MKKHEIIKYMNVTSDIHAKMPDIEQVREKCLNQSTDEMAAKENVQKKLKIFKPAKIIATAAALILIIGLVNIQTVIAFISGLFYVPGYGILNDVDFNIYAAKEQVILGDFIIDAVTRTVDENESTVCIWLFRADEIQMTDEERISGIPPLELTNITAVFDDGTEIKAQPGLMATIGFSYYMFNGTPDTNTFRLRDNNGNEAMVTLEDISKTEYADLKGIKFGDVSLTVVPLSGTSNIFAAELTDKFTLNLSKYASNTGLNAEFYMESADGNIAYAHGDLMLNGYKDTYKYGTITTNKNSYNMNATKLMLNYIFVSHSFYNIKDEYSIIVPNEGENINCNVTIFDHEGIKLKIKSVKNENGILTCETETIDKRNNKYRTKAVFDFEIGIYADMQYDDYDNIDENGNPAKVEYRGFSNLPRNSNYYEQDKNNYNIARYNLTTWDSIEIKPGDELFVKLDRLAYAYHWDKKNEQVDYKNRNPEHNLGVINLK